MGFDFEHIKEKEQKEREEKVVKAKHAKAKKDDQNNPSVKNLRLRVSAIEDFLGL